VYPSDLTDEQWEIIEPMLPLIKEPGRVPKQPFRDVVDAILYLDRSGCSWRQLPVDFPPWQTVYGWFQRWKQRGVTERILAELREQIRLAEGRNAQPSAGVIDSQSVKAADTVSCDTRGYDAGAVAEAFAVRSPAAGTVPVHGGEPELAARAGGGHAADHLDRRPRAGGQTLGQPVRHGAVRAVR
jgi:transposase